MELNNIEALLEKYDNAETTLQEEALLSDYFNSDNVASHLEYYKPMFGYFKETREDTFTKEVILEPKKKKSLYQLISVAAAVLLMFGIMIPQIWTSGPTQSEKDEALLAYNQTIEILNLISIGMNEGKKQLNTIALLSDNIDKGTEQVKVLSEFNKATNKFLKTTNN